MSGFRFTLSRPATTINSIPSWQDLGNGAASWGISGISQVVTLGSFQTSNWLADDILNPYLGTYNFLVTATGTVSGGAGVTAQITFHFLDADENIIQSGTAINIPNAGLSAYEVAFTATPITPAYVMIQVNNSTSSSNTVTVAVTHVAPTSSLVISEPDGWKGAKIKWERDPEFFSIIEYFDGAANGAFIFYGQNADEGVDGGIEFIRDAEADFGFDVKLSILIEYTSDDVVYTTLFQGLLDVSMKNEMPDNKMQVPVIQDDLWVKFVNRYESQVNLSDNVDLDGNPVDPVTPITVRLTCQKIQKKYAGRYLYAYTVGQLEDEGYEYYQPDFEQETFNEIEGKITLPRLPVNAVDPMFIMEEDGEYTFDVKLTLGHSAPIDANFSYSTLGKYIPYIQINDGTPVAFTGSDVTYGSDVVTEWTYNDVLTLSRLDQVRIYVDDQFDFSTDRLFIFGDEGFQFSGAFQYGESYMNVTGNTTYIDTEADAYLIHDAFHGVCARLGLGTDSFYSEFLGSTLTNSKQYGSDGCGWMYAVLKGLHVRGYGLSDKPFFTSLKELWEGINPILNVYLGYETISLVDKIRIEQKSEVIGATAPVNFSNVRDITSTYDKDFIFKTIKTGYKKWQAEEISGLNDPQTKHTYQTVISRSGREISLESGFIAASGAIETTRRTTIEKTADYKLDNDTFIISLNTNDFSPDVYVPELDENFSAITGLLNYETRYNLVLTPMRNLLRWANYLGGCLQNYLNSSYKFVSGEGNFAMASNADLGACERAVLTDNLSEDDDISLADYNSDFGFFFLPLLCDIKIPMEKEDFDLLDRKRPIGISQTDSGHTLFHIKEMEYELIKGEATIKAWPETFFNITVPEQTITMPVCEADASGDAAFDADYQAVLDYATAQGYTLPSASQQVIQNDFVLDLKAAGAWARLDVLYVFATDGDRSFAKINWKDPGSFSATEEVSALTFTADEGFTPTGANYLDTHWVPSTDAVNYSLNSAAVFHHTNTDSQSNTALEYGVRHTSDASGRTLIMVRNTLDQVGSLSLNSGVAAAGANTNAIGFYLNDRSGSGTTAHDLYKDGALNDGSNAASGALPDQSVYIGGLHESGGTFGNASTREISCWGAGSSMADIQSDLYTAWNTYFSSL